MAKADAKHAAAETEAPKKSKKMLVIILGVVLLLVVVGGAAAFFLMKSSDHDEEEDAPPVKKEKKHKKGEKEAPPIYLPLEPFTVNLVPESGDQYLQVAVSVQFEDPMDGEKMKQNVPRLRNDITLLLSSKKASQLVTREGKETLAEEIREQISEIVEPGSTKPDKKGNRKEGPAKAVLFTSFIIQ